jgi:HSP20 family protein
MALPERRPPAATTQRWQPLADFDQVSDRMRRLLDDSLGGLIEAAAWAPPVDIEETDDAYVVEAELPGVDRKDVDIEFVGNELAITGEIKEKERAGILRRKTRRVGRFEFRVVLPDHVDGDNIDASLTDGVLRVRVPKAERAQRRRIEVKS